MQKETRRGTTKCFLGWLFIIMTISESNSSQTPLENRTGTNNEKGDTSMGLISPRMDYEEWTPLGRGDPLKNNPTFDYVPPVLDNVRYWLDSQTTEASTKRDILVLGVTAKKTSAPIPECFFNLRDSIDSQLTPSEHSISIKGQLERRSDFTGSSGAEPPHILRSSNFKHKFVPPNDYGNPRKTQRLPASYYPTRYYTQHGKLHTNRLLPDAHQSSHQSQDHRLYLPNISSGRLEDNISASSQKNFANGQKLVSNQATGEANGATKGLLLPPRPPTREQNTAENQANADRVKVEKSNLIYQSSHTISDGDWLGTRLALLSKPKNQFTEYVDHDVSSSINRPVLVLANATFGQPFPNKTPENPENNRNILNEESSFSSLNATVDAPTLYKDSLEVYDPKVDPKKSESNDSTEETKEKMHIIIANSQIPDQLIDTTANERKVTSMASAVSIVMPTNYSNGTFTLKPIEMTTESSHSVDKLIPRIPDVSHSSSSVIKSTQLSNLGQYSGSDNLLPSNAPSLSTERTELKPHEHPDLHLTPHSSFRPNSQQRHPYTHLYLPAGMYSHPHTQLMLDSVGKKPGTMTFSTNVLHSTFDPQSANSPILTQNPMKLRGPPTPGMLMSMPVEMRVSMTMPKSHLSPMAGHMFGGMNSKKTFSQMPPKQVSFHPPHTRTHANLAGGLMDHMQSYSKSTPRPGGDISNINSAMIVSPIAVISTASVENVEQLNRSKETNTGIIKNIQLYTPSEDDRMKNKGHSDELPVISRGTDEEQREPDIDGKKGNSNETNIDDELESSRIHPKTTTVPSLTTDPIFSHYKQPAKPLRGPMYLIIQGHSKVKTYKPNVTMHPLEKARMELQGNQITEEMVEKNLSNFDRYVRVRENAIKEEKSVSTSTEENVLERKNETDLSPRQQTGTLMSLIKSGLGQISTSALPLDILRVEGRNKPELVNKRESENE